MNKEDKERIKWILRTFYIDKNIKQTPICYNLFNDEEKNIKFIKRLILKKFKSI